MKCYRRETISIKWHSEIYSEPGLHKAFSWCPASLFISALQDVERNQGTLMICVTFLDFENYFHTISLPALFLLLHKFGMNENDVQALRSCYEQSRMRVIYADGGKSAKIPLHRGLRQGCPLSPRLRVVVVNAMLQWLEFKGGGLSQSDVVTNTLCLADISTLMTTNVHDMNVLFACVNCYYQWAGVKINIGKTDVTGYNYKRKCSLHLSIL